MNYKLYLKCLLTFAILLCAQISILGSRVWGGIHFTFDQNAGQSAGRNVANYVFQNFMRPRQCVQ
ncbi:MAG TPA: hypothetical protein VF648_03445 [Pyrinomonadaceae bacterium]